MFEDRRDYFFELRIFPNLTTLEGCVVRSCCYLGASMLVILTHLERPLLSFLGAQGLLGQTPHEALVLLLGHSCVARVNVALIEPIRINDPNHVGLSGRTMCPDCASQSFPYGGYLLRPEQRGFTLEEFVSYMERVPLDKAQEVRRIRF